MALADTFVRQVKHTGKPTGAGAGRGLMCANTVHQAHIAIVS